MPAIEHETPTELIRYSPLLALDVVRQFTGLTGQEEILQAARQVPEHNRKGCVTLMLAVASDTARKAMEAKMATVAYRNEFIESFVDQGVAQGRAEQLADAILEVLHVRGIEVSAHDAERIHGCPDLDRLHAWHRAAVTAQSADEVFRA